MGKNPIDTERITDKTKRAGTLRKRVYGLHKKAAEYTNFQNSELVLITRIGQNEGGTGNILMTTNLSDDQFEEFLGDMIAQRNCNHVISFDLNKYKILDDNGVTKPNRKLFVAQSVTDGTYDLDPLIADLQRKVYRLNFDIEAEAERNKQIRMAKNLETPAEILIKEREERRRRMNEEARLSLGSALIEFVPPRPTKRAKRMTRKDAVLMRKRRLEDDYEGESEFVEETIEYTQRTDIYSDDAMRNFSNIISNSGIIILS